MSVVAVRFHETCKCPPGSIAWHATLGLVDVLQARGWERVVRIGRPAPAAAEVADVDVRELELIDAGSEQFGVALPAGEFRSLVEADEAELAELRAWEAEHPVPAPRGRGGRRG